MLEPRYPVRYKVVSNVPIANTLPRGVGGDRREVPCAEANMSGPVQPNEKTKQPGFQRRALEPLKENTKQTHPSVSLDQSYTQTALCIPKARKFSKG